MAAEYAEAFGGQQEAYLAGLLHDAGKAMPEFQAYLRAAHEGRRAQRFPHSIWGAALAWDAGGERLQPTVSAILGHHTLLKDWPEARRELVEFTRDNRERLMGLRGHLPLGVPDGLQSPAPTGHRTRDLWTRFIYSALIDADRTDTAEHFGAANSGDPTRTIPELDAALRADQEKLQREAPPSLVNDVRRTVYVDALQAALNACGFYRLTVPTGGGKTRSGMAFALRHAATHGMRRIIVAIPFTTIAEQNAKVYNGIFGPENVLEHHSRVTLGEPDELDADEMSARYRLTAERWDRPVIITTNVQLFETLFAARPRSLRKLHRIAKSVILLDEFQAFPPQLLAPTLRILRELVEHYGCTVVLSTATQPAFDSLPPHLVIDAEEIVQNSEQHFETLKRVQFEWRPTPMDWSILAQELEQEAQALVILNTRADAIELLDELRKRNTFTLLHLSTLLCGQHREQVLREVTKRLENRESVTLVSTQVVEAGVDFDFPIVYRALGPMDSIIQAAGRCNREGASRQGKVVVFRPREERIPRGAYRTGTGIALAHIERGGSSVLSDPATVKAYFDELYAAHTEDRKRIDESRDALLMERIARDYRLIDSLTYSVVVDFQKRGHSLARAWAAAPSLGAWRAFQPYVVELAHHDRQRAIEDKKIEPLTSAVDLWTGPYDEQLIGVAAKAREVSELVI